MTLIRRSAKKGAKGYLTAKGAKKAAKAARKTVKGWAIYKFVQKLAPTRLLVALGGVAAAALAATVAKRKSRSGAGQPPGPEYGTPQAVASDPDDNAARYVETQQTGA